MEKLEGSLIGVDSNAFGLMGYFMKQAKRQGWSDVKINEVIKEAESWDYAHLVLTLNDYFID